MERTFSISNESWWACKDETKLCTLTVYKKGEFIGEVTLELSDLTTPEVRVLQNGWAVLAMFQDLFIKLSELKNANISQPDLKSILLTLGFSDATQYTRP